MNINKIKNQLWSLKQNKDKSEEEIEKLAKEKILEQEILNSLIFCVTDEEKDYAKNLLESYLNQSSFENFSERDTLISLIDNEVLAYRIKLNLKDEYLNSNKAIPLGMLSQLRETNDQIIILKEKLNLLNLNKDSAEWVEVWDKLKKKAIKYFQENQGLNYIKCPHCLQIFQLLMKTDKYTAQVAAMFRGTDLYNKKVMELIEEQRINRDEAAQILGVAANYIDMIYNEIYLKEKNQ